MNTTTNRLILSVAIVIQSDTPPEGFVRSPIKLLPTPRKKLSTPSCCDPKTMFLFF